MARKTKAPDSPDAHEKLTPELQEQLCGYLALGLSISDACDAAQIGRATYYNWLSDAEDQPQSKYGEFLRATRKARATGKARHLGIVTTAAQKGDWKASAWHLEHVYPEEFGRIRHEISGPDGNPIEAHVRHNLKKLSPEQLLALEALQQAARKTPDSE